MLDRGLAVVILACCFPHSVRDNPATATQTNPRHPIRHAEFVFDALDHVIVAVRDLSDATRRYATLLSRSPSWRGEHPGWGTANTLFRLDNTYLELITPDGDGPLGRTVAAQLDQSGDGPIGLAFATSDLDAIHARLVANGLEPPAVSRGQGRDTASGMVRHWRSILLPQTRTRGVLIIAIEHESPNRLPEAAPVGSADASPDGIVTGIDHAVVQTSDADGAIALYRDGLGLRLALDRSFPDWGMRLVFLRVGKVTVEIAQPLGGEAPRSQTDHLWGLSWRVPDADAARARLVTAGLDVSEVRPGRKPGTRVLSVKNGTCGVPTLLIEPR
jgi:catechol 2,3-dioxygenase-like lactoylglutathione lyase family enzyme